MTAIASARSDDELPATISRLRWQSRIHWRSKVTVALVAVLLLYALVSVKRSELKPLWFDELGTLNVATQPTLRQMFRVEPADGNPPLQYLLVRPCLQVLGTTALALRLPALLFVGLAIACVYVFVGRRFGAAAGLVTAMLFACSPLGDYGVEARPYGLLFGLTALLLVLWQRAAETGGRRRSVLAALGWTVFALVIAHPTGFLWAGVPLLAGEVSRWRRTRRLDTAMLTAILLGFCGFAITLFFGHETQRVLVAAGGGKHPGIALPSTHRFVQALRLEGIVPPMAVLLAVGLPVAWRRRQPDNLEIGSASRAAPRHEWVAVGALCFTSLLVYVFTLLVTHYFWGRYVTTGLLGWFLLVGMACGSAGRRWVAVAAVCLGLLLIGVERRRLMVSAMPWPKGYSVASLLSQGDTSEPILLATPAVFPDIWWNSPPALRVRLHAIADAPHATATEDFIGDLTLIAMHHAGSRLFVPDALEPFLATNRRFLFWHRPPGEGDWLEGYLRSRGYRFTPVAHDPNGLQTLYQVVAPGGGF